MLNTFFATKTGMAGRFTEKGTRTGATLLSVLPMKVADLRTKEKHGYTAVRLEVTNKNPKIIEIRTDEVFEPGTEFALTDLINIGDLVSVTGTTKGHGFAGAVKRHGFRGGPRTHGQSDRERAPGSSGSTTTPGRVYKGKRRAGHMGVDTVMVKNLKVLEVDAEKKTLVISGSVPGANRYTLLTIKKLA